MSTLLKSLVFSLFVLIHVSDKKDITGKPESSRSGTAIIMTGAAARISQQAALLEELYDRGELRDVVFISGVSAGAINAVMLNAILEGKITWDEYREILFNIRNQDIFKQAENRKLPVDTQPERELFRKIVEDRLGYYRIGDLPVMTEISFTKTRNLDFKRRVYRICSRKINSETDTTLSLVDILMATSAIPIVFPSVSIENVTSIPDARYVDGGLGQDYVPFHSLLEFQEHRGRGVAKVYIISRKSADYVEISDELRALGIDSYTKFDNLGLSVDKILRRILLNRLETFARKSPEMILISYVWIPDFDEDFLMLNFDNLEEQYKLTRAWAKENNPISLGDFVLYNKFSKKEKD